MVKCCFKKGMQLLRKNIKSKLMSICSERMHIYTFPVINVNVDGVDFSY